jgi:hypothetical protein
MGNVELFLLGVMRVDVANDHCRRIGAPSNGRWTNKFECPRII